jgi:hypothetical protein
LVYFMAIWCTYFMAIWCILWPFGNVVVIWYIFPLFGILHQEKSGNTARNELCHQNQWYRSLP